jgi:hypothetical protein
MIGMITKAGVLDMQVCVPSYWTDEQIIEFANATNPSGLDAGWHIRKAGNPLLDGAPERVTCKENPDMVHIMLDC